jgi:hypothetical protein
VPRSVNKALGAYRQAAALLPVIRRRQFRRRALQHEGRIVSMSHAVTPVCSAAHVDRVAMLVPSGFLPMIPIALLARRGAP